MARTCLPRRDSDEWDEGEELAAGPPITAHTHSEAFNKRGDGIVHQSNMSGYISVLNENVINVNCFVL